MKKSVIAILTATVIMVSFLGVSLFSQVVQAADPANWYMTVSGVLATDNYSLYPFDEKSLKIGFSQFGELIDSNTNVGLEYGTVDPFAAPAGSSVGSIPKSMWLNGWLINITYHNIPQGKYRNVWATAQFADSTSFGNPWIRVDFANDYSATYGYEDPRDPGYIIGNYDAGALNFGGRKTNGTAVTAPITVLYNGPRLFVAVVQTTIYDHPVFLSDDTSSDIPLVSVYITIVFNKVKKEVVLLKDVKSLLTEKVGQFMRIQFSNRGEVDLGTETAGYHNYFHFYTKGTGYNDTQSEGIDTVYDGDWTMCPTDAPATQNSAYGNQPGTTYDVAQAINPTAGYVWWAAFWPSLSDWTIDGWAHWWRSMTSSDPHYIDAAGYDVSGVPIEPKIPYYIGEWDFTLYAKEFALTSPIQFRGVTVYGVTDKNNAYDDDQDGVHGEYEENVIDREAKYQLDEVFNPWDLNDAVHKATRRWVEYELKSDGTFTTTHKPVKQVSNATWDQYCVFSERVEDLTEDEVEARVGYAWKGQDTYTVTYNPDGTMTISGLDVNHDYKILYSTLPEWGGEGSISLTEAFLNFSDVDPGESVNFIYSASYLFAADPLGVIHGFNFEVEMEITVKSTVNSNFTESNSDPSLDGVHYDFKVFKEETNNNHYYFWDNVTYSGTNVTITCVSQEPTILTWNITSPEETVHMDLLDIRLWLATEISYNYNASQLNVTFVPCMVYGYIEHMGGRYEWGIVGRDAKSVDSAGLSMVSAAFKNKQIEYGLAGADMYDPALSLQMPWIMSKIGPGTTRVNYYYSGTDYRTALKDDWCTTWPIASSNIIVEAGPRANVLAWYANDFAQAFFGLTEFTDYEPWDTVIIPLTCWNPDKTRSYKDSGTTGYAVISTYKDINGTVLFNIWGYDGIDTYYVSKWFHEEGIYQLQYAPEGLTAIIVKITYQSTGEGYKPTGYSIVECLGTISETEWAHGSETKGGIHDP